MKKRVWAQYEERLHRVFAYIRDHLDDELDLEKMTEIACLSPWHWHRIYKAVHGETAVATIKRLRLHRAAGDLVQSRRSIRAIAKRAGYPNIQSFTRTFQAAYGQSPLQYRNTGDHALYRQAITQKDEGMFEIEVKTLAPMRLLGLPHSGPYMGIAHTFAQLWSLAKTRQLDYPGKALVGVGIYEQDPEITPPEKLQSFAAFLATAEMIAEPPLSERILAGGNYACLRVKGPYAGLDAAYQWFFKTWLPGSGRVVGTAPVHEVYLNNPSDTLPAELLTEIRLPLA